jgi:hypothetical protein
MHRPRCTLCTETKVAEVLAIAFQPFCRDDEHIVACLESDYCHCKNFSTLDWVNKNQIPRVAIFKQTVLQFFDSDHDSIPLLLFHRTFSSVLAVSLVRPPYIPDDFVWARL